MSSWVSVRQGSRVSLQPKTFMVRVQLTESNAIVLQTDPSKKIQDLLLEIPPLFGREVSPLFGIWLTSLNDFAKNSATLQELNVKIGDTLIYKPKAGVPLYVYIGCCELDELRSKLKKATSEELQQCDHLKRNFLHLLCHYGDLASIKFLLKKKLNFDINQQDLDGNTAFMYACKSGDCQKIEYVASHLNPNMLIKNNDDMTCLHYFCSAATAGQPEPAVFRVHELLLGRGLSSFSRTKATEDTPAHFAAKSSNITSLKFCIEYDGFPINLPNADGDTCLHLAARKGCLVSVDVLLELGAEKTIANLVGAFPFDIALDKKADNIVTRLVDYSRDDEKLYFAIKENNLELVKSILEESAASRRRTDRMKNLFASGLSWSSARFNLQICEFILDHPALNLRYNTESGKAALFHLCRCKSSSVLSDPLYTLCLKKILEGGISINERSGNRGDTPLHISAISGNRTAIQFLLDNNAFTNNVNFKGETELHYAVVSNHNKITNDLLKAGSDPYVTSSRGENCINLAKRLEFNEIRDILEVETANAASLNVFQPNVVVITLISGSDLLPKDETGFSDPYCIFKHRLADQQRICKSNYQVQTLNPAWNETFKFYFKKDNLFYRDILIDCYDYDEKDDSVEFQEDDFIGRSTLILDPRVKEQEVTLTLQDQMGKSGTIKLFLKFEMLSDEDSKPILEDYKAFDVLEQVQSILKTTKSKSVGTAKAAMGFLPKYPILIIPGLASSALECWTTQHGAWKRERVWVDPFKIGKAAALQKISNRMNKKKSKNVTIEKDDDNNNNDDDANVVIPKDERRWLKHIMTAPDGFSDPPGIRVRPLQGLHGIDFLAENPLAKKASYVFGYIIQQLIDVGYSTTNLDAFPYDWRLPPEKLEERDKYFTKLKTNIEYMKEINNEKVVLLAHSMGNRCVQYFLLWAKENPKLGEAWIDDNIHAFLAMGPPFLGAPKSTRAVLSGDCMGLDVFLTPEEARTMARGSGSLPWLFPIQEDQFPDVIARINHTVTQKKSEKGKGEKEMKKRKSSTGISASKITRQMSKEIELINDAENWEEYRLDMLVQKYASQSYSYFQNFYVKNPMYLHQAHSDVGLPPVLSPPPVKNLWVINGINLPTEVSYYYHPHTSSKGEVRLVLDSSADAYSNKKIAIVNPRGLKIQGGMGYETKLTYQPSARANKSGDGTVPYCSLNYAMFWKEYAKENNLPLEVTIVEIEGADHREMLNHDAVFNAIMDFVCEKPINKFN